MAEATATTAGSQDDDRAKVLRRAIGASAMGNMTEWYDYGVYSYTTTYITKQFFPDLGLAATLMVFAVSFIFRPLGGCVFGPLGDRLGRKAVLAITIIMMASATFALGLLPTHSTIGLWAPALLIFLRVVQGFSAGGEYGGAATFMAEYSPDRRRGFLGSFLEFGTLAGFTLGALVALGTELAVGGDAMASWGWRVPFLIGLPLGLVGLYLRTKLEDTPVFKELEKEQDEGKRPLREEFRELFTKYRRPVFALFGLVVALNVCNYTLLAYTPTYLQDTIGLGEKQALLVVIIGQLAMMLVIPFSGRLSDRVGRKPMWWASLGGMFALAVPMYMLIGSSFALALVGFAVLGLLYVMQLSTISATFPAMFPTQVRYAGFAIAYNVSTAIFGGTALYVNQALISSTGNNLMPAFYTMLACVVGGVSLMFVPETARASIRGTGIPGIDTKPKPAPAAAGAVAG